MINWQNIIDADYTVPTWSTVADLADPLVEALADPDPAIRDGSAYRVMGRWIRDGVLDSHLEDIGTRMAQRLTDPRVQARTFAPLVLCWIIQRGTFQQGWVDAFASWYPEEKDLRGYDNKLGWLHAVAHGADLLGTFAGRTDVDPSRLLELATRRMLAETDAVWRDAEDDRLGHALALTLTRPELSAGASVAWLTDIERAWREGKPGPMPAEVSNTVRTLRVLYIFVDRGVRRRASDEVVQLPYRAEVKAALAAVMSIVEPFAG